MDAPLRVEPGQSRAGRVVLARYIWAGAGWDTALHVVAGAGHRVARSRVRGDRRDLWHHEWRDGVLRALDHTVFHLDGGAFVEAERYRVAGGPNLHAAPIVLPAELSVGEAVAVLGDPRARVTVTYAGPVRLTRTDAPALGPVELDAIAIEATDGVHTRVQWMGRDVGELALGPPGGPWERALVAWSPPEGDPAGGGPGSSTAAPLFGGAPAGLSRAAYPDLPAASSSAPPGGLW